MPDPERLAPTERGAVHLFALRSTSPRALYDNLQPSPANDQHLVEVASRASLVVCAWGTHGAQLGRGEQVRQTLGRYVQLHHLGLTKDGHPRHPLYLKADLQPLPWGPLAEREASHAG